MLDYRAMQTIVLEHDAALEALPQIQEEPALEIALPQVFTQPVLTTLRRGKLPHVEWLVARLSRASTEQHGTNGHGLGPDYQALVNEFQPLFTWAIACWDYLLSTEGCRFVLRSGDEKSCCRGDYRAVTDTDYSRLVHRVFRHGVLDFAHTAVDRSLSAYLRTHFWDAVLHAYRQLDEPLDPRQRTLTPYSYLRCAPYQFLNSFHHDLVHRTLHQLPPREQQAIEWYFLRFFTREAAAQAMGLPQDEAEAVLRRGLTSLLVDDRLVYCLLRQIERY